MPLENYANRHLPEKSESEISLRLETIKNLWNISAWLIYL